eukprot:gene53908-7202_t
MLSASLDKPIIIKGVLSASLDKPIIIKGEHLLRDIRNFQDTIAAVCKEQLEAEEARHDADELADAILERTLAQEQDVLRLEKAEADKWRSKSASLVESTDAMSRQLNEARRQIEELEAWWRSSKVFWTQVTGQSPDKQKERLRRDLQTQQQEAADAQGREAALRELADDGAAQRAALDNMMKMEARVADAERDAAAARAELSAARGAGTLMSAETAASDAAAQRAAESERLLAAAAAARDAARGDADALRSELAACEGCELTGQAKDEAAQLQP